MKKLVLLACLVCSAGCGPRFLAPPRHQHPTPPDRHIVAPLRGPVSDINTHIDRQLTVSLGAFGLSLFGLVFVAIEATAFLRIAVAVSAGCAAMTVGLLGLRLIVPIVAMLIPWFVGAAVLAGLIAAWVWADHGGARIRLLKWWRARKKQAAEAVDRVKLDVKP